MAEPTGETGETGVTPRDFTINLPDLGDDGDTSMFENEDNRRRKRKVEELTKEQHQTISEIEDNLQRIRLIKDHAKNVDQELTATQALTMSRTRDIESEDHMKQVVERKAGRLNSELAKIETRKQRLQDQFNKLQNSIFRKNETLDEAKRNLVENQEELGLWLEAAKMKEEDTLVLQKYAKTDENKIKQLTLTIEKRTLEVSRQKKILDNEIMETQATQIELERTAEAFRRLYAERQQQIKQWQDTIAQMQKRDAEINAIAEHESELKSEVTLKQEKINEKKHFLDQLVQNNVEVDRKIDDADRKVGHFRQIQKESEATLSQIADEVRTMKRTLQKTHMEKGSVANRIKGTMSEIDERTQREGSVSRRMNLLKAQFTEESQKRMTKEEALQALEESYNQTVQKHKDADKDMEAKRTQQFKHIDELNKYKTDESELGAEINGTKAASKNLAMKHTKLMEDIGKQHETIYSQQFQLQHLERHISLLSGERSEGEQKQQQQKVQDLTTELDKRTKTCQLLQTQMKRLQSDLRQQKRSVDTCKQKKDTLSGRIDELNLHNDSASRQLKKVRSTKEQLMVDENLMKLELKRLMQTLSGQNDNVYSLERQKLDLRLSIEERNNTIQLHMDMLKTQMRTADSERKGVAVELRDKMAQVENMKKRYEVMMSTMQMSPEGNGEGEKSQAYFVIKAAQEREELQQEGDELDAVIRKAEKEIRALMNTLRLMNERNEQYRKSFTKADMFGKDIERKKDLEEQIRAVMDKYKFKRREIKELQEETSNLEATLSNLVFEEEHIQGNGAESSKQSAQLSRVISEQKAKRDRAYKQVMKLSKNLHHSKNFPQDQETDEEKDFRYREIKDYNNQIIRNLQAVASKHVELTPAYTTLMDELGIPVAASSCNSRPSTGFTVRSAASSNVSR